MREVEAPIVDGTAVHDFSTSPKNSLGEVENTAGKVKP